MLTYYKFSQGGFVTEKIDSPKKLQSYDVITIIFRVIESKSESVFLFSLVEENPIIDTWSCKQCNHQNILFFSHLEEILRDTLYENNLSLTFVHV